MFKGKNIILGVTSSIAAYKSANVASALVKKGCNVNVLMTENATNFINPLTFEELTKHKCIIDTFDRNVQYNVAHISLAVSADAFIYCACIRKCYRQNSKRNCRRYAYYHCYGMQVPCYYFACHEYKYVRKSNCSRQSCKT